MTQTYTFSNAFGGLTTSTSPPQILAKLRDVRLQVGSLKAQKQPGVMYPVKSAKELFQKLAQAITDHDVVASVIAQDIHYEDTSKIPGNQTSSGKPVFRTLVHVKATVRFVAPDGSYMDFVGSGHGGDGEDRAGGKGSTYAYKDAVTKGLCLPDESIIDTDDEHPDEKAEKPAKPASKTPADPGTGPTGNSANLDAAIEALKAATSIAALEAVGAKIKAGEWGLAGSDKLRASATYVERKKALTAPE